jgi:hypothetical protein
MSDKPTVFVAILAKEKAATLPFYLETLNNWDYPKDRMHIYIRTNNNTDETEDILNDWVRQYGSQYMSVLMDYTDVPHDLESLGVHEWTSLRFSVLASIRRKSIQMARQMNADYYFVSDVDNYLFPHTLSAMVETGVSAVSPMLHYANGEDEAPRAYSNFHNEANEYGYYKDNPAYFDIIEQKIKGLIAVDVMHCTYLLRQDILDQCDYFDGTEDYEYVIFSRILRDRGIQQYLDNREIYGYLTLTENAGACRTRMGM